MKAVGWVGEEESALPLFVIATERLVSSSIGAVKVVEFRKMSGLRASAQFGSSFCSSYKTGCGP